MKPPFATLALARSAAFLLALASSSPARGADCSHALPDSALDGTMLATLSRGATILFWGDSITARGGDNNFAQMFVRIVNGSFARFCDDGTSVQNPNVRALMRGSSQRKSYREASELRATVGNLQPYWVVIQDAGDALPVAPAVGTGFDDDVLGSIDAVFEPGADVKALILMKTPPLDEPGRDVFVCQGYASACNWTAHNVVLDQVADAQVGRTVVTAPTDVDVCSAMARTGMEFAEDGVHPEKVGYLVYALSLLRAVGIDPAVIPEAVLAAQGLPSVEAEQVRAALASPPASAAHPRCTMDPSCQPEYLDDPAVSGSAMGCIAYCHGPGSESCRPAFRSIGSCCLASGSCVHGVVASECPAVFYGAVGACCHPTRGCLAEATRAICEAEGGVYQGDGVRCVEGCCNAPASCPGCGDGVVEEGEACDDGNRLDGDCCAWNCFRAEEDGVACDDGIWCNGADSCAAAACTVHDGDPCTASSGTCKGDCNEADDSCDLPAGSTCSDPVTCASAACAASGSCLCDGEAHCSLGALCPLCAGAREDCANPGKSKLQMRSPSGSTSRTLSFRTSAKGDVVHPTDFGDPMTTAGSGLALCVYVHASGSEPTRDDLLWEAPFAAGELCDGIPCWTSGEAKLAYARSANQTSLRARIQTSTTTTGRLRMNFQAAGAPLGLPDVLGIAGDQRVTVQLLTGKIDGATTRCWQKTFDDGVVASTDELFSALTAD